MKVDVTVSCGELKKDGRCKSLIVSNVDCDKLCCLFCSTGKRKPCPDECEYTQELFRLAIEVGKARPETIRPIKEK